MIRPRGRFFDRASISRHAASAFESSRLIDLDERLPTKYPTR